MKLIKLILSTIILFGCIMVASAQSNWKEQVEFHKVMSTTFHPAEEGNLEPIKSRSSELAEKAEVWRKSEIPSDVKDKKMVKKTLNKLCKDSKNLDKNIKKGISDDEIKNQLSQLHDTFHTIVGLCRAKGKDEHDHEH